MTTFDPALVCLLKEVKYFLVLGIDVPSDAIQIYEPTEMFCRRTGNLDLIVNKSNAVLKHQFWKNVMVGGCTRTILK